MGLVRTLTEYNELKAQLSEERRIKSIKFRMIIIPELINLCKGRVYEPWGDFFYETLITRKEWMAPTSINEAREKLQKAWWIEEEEIKQQISYIIWHVKLGTINRYMMLAVWYNLRDWLLKQRVFSRQSEWEENYQYYIEEVVPSTTTKKPVGLELIFSKNNLKPLNAYDKYNIYLRYVAEMRPQETDKILTSINYRKANSTFCKKLKELLNESEITNGPCK